MDSTDYILFVPMFFLAIYLWLESQDFGVAIVAPMVAQNEEERKTALNLLKPGLDGNEAWAFPARWQPRRIRRWQRAIWRMRALRHIFRRSPAAIR